MFAQPGGYGSPSLESYSLEATASTARFRDAAVASEQPEPEQPELTITLRGSNFITRAMMPIIRIGDIWVQDYRIVDEHTIVCNLHELPEEGAPISISYGSNQQAELAEGFSMRKLGDSSSNLNES